MKKKNLKSLSLNKKRISNLEATKVDGGLILLTITCLTCTCTFGEVCQAAGDFVRGVYDGYNESANN